jgi:hypothetical protein
VIQATAESSERPSAIVFVAAFIPLDIEISDILRYLEILSLFLSHLFLELTCATTSFAPTLSPSLAIDIYQDMSRLTGGSFN